MEAPANASKTDAGRRADIAAGLSKAGARAVGGGERRPARGRDRGCEWGSKMRRWRGKKKIRL